MFEENEKKRRVRKIVAKEIEHSTPWPSERESLSERLSERLDDEGDWRATLSTGIIAKLCEELGLDPDWTRWENEIRAIEESQSHIPGSPYEYRFAAGPDPP